MHKGTTIIAAGNNLLVLAIHRATVHNSETGTEGATMYDIHVVNVCISLSTKIVRETKQYS